MKINVHVGYSEEYIPPRCRKPRYRDKYEDIELNIEEPLEDVDMHKAFRVKDFDSDVMIFQYRDWLYREAEPRDLIAGDTSKSAFQILEDLCKNSSIFFEFGRSREFAIARAKKYIDKFLFWKGNLFINVDEPMYSYNTFGLGHNHGGTGFFVADHYNPNLSWKNYFNALHKKEAIEVAVNVALRRGDTESVQRIINTKCDIEVFDESLVHRNPKKDHGDGCEYLNSIESIISNSDNVLEAGLLTMLLSGVTSSKEET